MANVRGDHLGILDGMHESQDGIELSSGAGPGGDGQSVGGSDRLLQEHHGLIDLGLRHHPAILDAEAVFLSG